MFGVLTVQEGGLGNYGKELSLALGEAFLPALAPLPCPPRSSLAIKWEVKDLKLLGLSHLPLAQPDFVSPGSQMEVAQRPSLDQIETTLGVERPFSTAGAPLDQSLLDSKSVPDPPTHNTSFLRTANDRAISSLFFENNIELHPMKKNALKQR